MNEKILSVRLYGKPIGQLKQMPSGKMQFKYSNDARDLVSIGMPLNDEPYDELICQAFFGGLLPESDNARKLIAKKYHISANNNFALLSAIGHDCAGALSFHRSDEPVIAHDPIPLAGKKISETELYALIKSLPSNPLFMIVNDLKLSLAGVQDKAAVIYLDNEIFLSEQDCPSTHILKPNPPHFHGLTDNEYFCLKIAKRIGLDVPHVYYKKINDISYLLIERYDRHIHNAYVSRIHQEDFCQALHIPSHKKYQNEGGPGFTDCFSLLNRTSLPAKDRNQLALAMVFNYLIGNMDAHAKNFSLLHHSNSYIRLAPFYDMICTRLYENLSSKMAMKIGSQYDSNSVLARHWEKLCNNINYRYLSLIKLIETTSQSLIVAMEAEYREIESTDANIKTIKKIITLIENNIDCVRRIIGF